MALLWAIYGLSRESHAIVLQIPTTKKSLLGEAQKVIAQKARFSLEKREKKQSFFVNQPYEKDWLTKNERKGSFNEKI